MKQNIVKKAEPTPDEQTKALDKAIINRITSRLKMWKLNKADMFKGKSLQEVFVQLKSLMDSLDTTDKNSEAAKADMTHFLEILKKSLTK